MGRKDSPALEGESKQSEDGMPPITLLKRDREELPIQQTAPQLQSKSIWE